jgi:hypothetical protein
MYFKGVVMAGKLYVGCGLTLASEQFKDNVGRLKERLRRDWDVMEFLGLVAGNAADVYRTDILENVHSCDAFVGVCDEPSIGLGWELAEATGLQKLVLAVAHVDSKVTRLVLGAPAYNPNFTFQYYEDMIQDVPRIAASILIPQVEQRT